MKELRDPVETVRSAIHEIRSRLSVIKMSVTTVADIDPELTQRLELLDRADQEATRISLDLSGLGAMMTAFLDKSRQKEVDIGSALRRAAASAARRGVRARITGPRTLTTRTRAAALEAILPALLIITGDLDGEVHASASKKGDAVVVRMKPPNGPWSQTKLTGSLVELLGAEEIPSEDSLVFVLPGART